MKPLIFEACFGITSLELIMGDNAYTLRRSQPYRTITRSRMGSPHRKYRDRRYMPLVKTVLRKIRLGVPIPEISATSKIPRSTLYSWATHAKSDPDWSPQFHKIGCHRRIFTPSEENNIAKWILTEILEKKMLFTDADCREILLREWRAKLAREPGLKLLFSCSAGYIHNFKKRNGFSSRRAHYKRRPKTDVDQCTQWTESISNLLKSKDNRLILNCDETFWRVFPGALMTWAPTNSENVTIDIKGSEKDGLTVLATIAADGSKLPLFFIASGKTERVETTQIRPEMGDWVTHTPSGWQTSDSFQLYLLHLRELFCDEPLDLILDVHSSHRTEEVKTLARNLDISLHYIPAGATDAFQPLDRRVFGALKSSARRLFRERKSVERSLADACEDLRTAWENLGSDVLEEAWDCY